MAQIKAEGSITVNVFDDSVKTRLSGVLNLLNNNAPLGLSGTGTKWAYKKVQAGTGTTTIFNASDYFHANPIDSTIAVTDKILWVAMKHSGFSDVSESTPSMDGVMINFTGTVPLYNGTNDTANNNMFIGPKEIFVSKLNGVLVEDLKFRTCSLNGLSGMPDGTGSGSGVILTVAAVIDDLG